MQILRRVQRLSVVAYADAGLRGGIWNWAKPADLWRWEE